MERKYETPNMEVIAFQCSDVVTSSGRDFEFPEDDTWVTSL